jgi:hypothetical protein
MPRRRHAEASEFFNQQVFALDEQVSNSEIVQQR